MNYRHFVCVAVVLISIRDGLCHPLASLQRGPKAYNLFQEFTPRDINDLGPEQRHKAMLDVKATIAEVQKLLTTDPNLPRLTKGEIEELFEKVTAEELDKSIRTGDKKREKQMRALMLVLPHLTEMDMAESNDTPVKKAVAEIPNKASLIQQSYVSLTQDKTREKPPAEDILKLIGLFPNSLIAQDLKKNFTAVETTEVPQEFKELLLSYGLLNKDHKSIGLAPLPVLEIDSEISEHLKNHKLEIDNEQATKVELKLPSLEEIKENLSQSPLPTAHDYSAFKPMTSKDEKIDEEMETFLKQFGLVDDQSRKSKSTINKEAVPTTPATPSSRKPFVLKELPAIDSDYLSPSFASLLGNIGIHTTSRDKQGKKISNSKAATNVFKNPTNNKSKVDEEDYRKLEQLLETIRELEKLNVNLTDKEINRLNVKNFNFSDSLLSKSGPNPLHNIEYSELKNSIKRQEPSKTDGAEDSPTKINLDLEERDDKPLLESSLEIISPSDTPTTTTTSTTTAAPKTSSTTPEPRNSLEDEIEPVEEEPLPAPIRSGFYFLSDWNSFLEVGEEPDKIVVRFDPKIGDPTRFIPVNIP
ncbi:unnamed protein product [Diamesa tonsa]